MTENNNSTPTLSGLGSTRIATEAALWAQKTFGKDDTESLKNYSEMLKQEIYSMRLHNENSTTYCSMILSQSALEKACQL